MNKIKVPPEIIAEWERLVNARKALARWKVEEANAKEAIFGFLGYDPDDPKPPSLLAVDDDGDPVFKVNSVSRRGVDVEYIKKRFPEVYAEAEKYTPAKTIKDASE